MTLSLIIQYLYLIEIHLLFFTVFAYVQSLHMYFLLGSGYLQPADNSEFTIDSWLSVRLAMM